jgi:hypothetical protein
MDGMLSPAVLFDSEELPQSLIRIKVPMVRPIWSNHIFVNISTSSLVVLRGITDYHGERYCEPLLRLNLQLGLVRDILF